MNLIKYNSWALLVKDTSKHYKIIENLENKDCSVVLINKKVGNVNGLDVYESLNDVPHNIDIVAIIEESIDLNIILGEMELLDIDNIWIDKNLENEEIRRKIKSMKLNIDPNVNINE
ncbi:MAG: CoA-binding protein [Romboutsia sp.]